MHRARAASVFLLLARAAAADTALPMLGARAGGMGGAFTALADDATAFHWNPAGLAHGPLFRFSFFLASGFEDRGELVNRLRAERPGESSSLTGDQAFGFSGEMTLLGVAVTRFSHTFSSLEADRLRSEGLETVELAATFVHSLPPDDLTLGVNLRYIRGTAFERLRPVGAISPSEREVRDLVEAATEGEGRSESELTADLGLLYQPRDWLRLGLSARNLTRPTFHTENGRELGLERHARAGLAFRPTGSLVFALDLDLTARGDHAGSRGWRELAVGAETSWMERRLSIRAGLRAELGDGRASRPAFSAGLGVRLRSFLVELGGSTGTARRHVAAWAGLSLTP